ncbi:hypothetical protein SAMN02927937_01502 [Paenimyroides aquimaris]|uniref:Lipoprotein n=1 Tax=Paenimyroides marinum TaxID=1159016 RepID=A0A1H6L6W2_9FLAO|nr:hypothetical protein [Paenimyroides aquimaris]SEH79950.1 hypothetical protein SAMN02927937_01502 [Paenimyroides aquimaris]
MKKIKIFALGIIGATLITTGLYSCSNEEVNNPQQENTEQNTNLQSKPATTAGDGYVYALDFYGTDISLGRSVDLVDPDTSEGVTVTEVTVDGDTRARGYIVNKVENNDFLYFLDVDRDTDILTTFEETTDEVLTFNNLLESPDYLDTDKFDFIEYSQDYMTTSGDCGFWKKVWGKCTFYGNINPIGNGLCSQTSTTVTYRLGKIANTEPNHNTFPCPE